MEQFVKQYGMVILYVMIGALIIGMALTMFRQGLREKAAVADGPKTDYQEAAMKRQPPLLLVEDKKISLGEEYHLADMAKAKEWGQNGKDITDKISVEVLDGDLLVSEGKVVTKQSGFLLLRFSVTDDYGIKAEKKVRLLVDGTAK